MKPSIGSPSTKTADHPAPSASEGASHPSPALGAHESAPAFAQDSWDWLAYARRPELLPEVMLAARPCLIILTTLLSFLSIIASFNIEKRVKEYFFWFLVLETGMLGVFVSLDFFLFYIFWEVMLVPMYFLIGI